jgi:hypothetical protein
VLQKTLDDLRVVHESTVLRLEKAEAKIHEMENAKVEKLDVDLMDVLTKPISHKGWIHDTVIGEIQESPWNNTARDHLTKSRFFS